MEDLKNLLAKNKFCIFDSNLEVAQLSHYWDDLDEDQYLESTKRKRRYGILHFENDLITLLKLEPHFQKIQYNKLFGELPRCFSPISIGFLRSNFLKSAIKLCLAQVQEMHSKLRIEVHQFRVYSPGNPTPEGVHQDGADYVMSMLIHKENIVGGTTKIYSVYDKLIKSHVMRKKGECILLNDKLLKHGVTEVYPDNAKLPSYRDTLVLAFFKL